MAPCGRMRGDRARSSRSAHGKGVTGIMASKTSGTGPPAGGSSGSVLSDVEREAMKATTRERKKAARLTPEEQRAAGEADVQAAIAEMAEDDRAMAARIHEIVLATAPGLAPRTFYGMPAYAKDGKVICFFQAKAK